MSSQAREALLLSISAAEAEFALDEVLAERGFKRTERRPPRSTEAIARSDARFFDVDELEPTLTVIREWMEYKDSTAWGVALELAESLPGAAQMEMALPPALSVLARALSRRITALGFAMRPKPWHFVGVAFRAGRAVDVITAANDRVVIGPIGELRNSSLPEMRTSLANWLTRYNVTPAVTELLLGHRDLPSDWRVAYVHEDARRRMRTPWR